jgi:4-amino-4-deoxy-L-arabinose transferase-like glycosyltransferase
MEDRPATSPAPWPRRAYAAFAALALAWLVAARVLGPSDAWAHAQPRTIAYTTDMLASGHWLLPHDASGLAATKPPLYNWIAAPIVKLLGFASEPAHKAPSVLALVACWLALALLAPRLLGPDPDWTVGWLAAAMFAAGHAVFKIGYLARPDMLLTAWLLLGWLAATAVLLAEAGLLALGGPARVRLCLAFWLCVGLAALTKGPAALTLPIYALAGARAIAGRFGAARGLRWSWGVPLAVAMFGSWVAAVWIADAHHLWNQLVKEEIVGRVTGLGALSNPRGPAALLVNAPNPTVNFLVRFAPWSIFAVLALAALWRRDPDAGAARGRTRGREGAALLGAGVFIIVTLASYTLSAGRRADYVAAAYPPAALLAAWWMLRAPPRLARRAPWLAPALAALVLGFQTVYAQLEINSPAPGFGDGVARVARALDARMREAPAPAVLWVEGNSYVPAFLGAAGKGGPDAVWRALGERRAFWLVTGPEQYETVRGRVGRGELGMLPIEIGRMPSVERSMLWKHDLLLVRFEPAPALYVAAPDGAGPGRGESGDAVR